MNAMENCTPTHDWQRKDRRQPEARRSEAALFGAEPDGGREENLLARIGEDLDSLGRILSWLAGAVTALRRQEDAPPDPGPAKR